MVSAIRFNKPRTTVCPPVTRRASTIHRYRKRESILTIENTFCRGIAHSSLHVSGDTPPFTNSRHSTISLCRLLNRLPPKAAFFQAMG